MNLVVLTGPPGAGKSTVAHALVARFDRSVLVEGDAFFAFLASGAVKPWLPESQTQNEVVTRAAASAARQYAEGGYTTIYDGIVGPWFLPTFVAAAGLDGVHYVMLMPSVETCLQRVATRTNHGFFDASAVRKMHDEFARAEIDPRHVMVDPPSVDATVEIIASGIADQSFVYLSA
jgi:Chromatin associated protein KTI12.